MLGVVPAVRRVAAAAVACIASSGPEFLQQVAFRTPAGRTVLIAFNADAAERRFTIQAAEGLAEAALPARAVGTYVW